MKTLKNWIADLNRWADMAALTSENVSCLSSGQLRELSGLLVNFYPEVLPCAVRLEPGLILGKGIRTEALLAALSRRAVYESDIAALSPEEKEDMRQRLEDFKKMLPAPMVPHSNNLLPCPFCGGSARRSTIDDEADPCFGGEFITCTKCGAASHVEFGFKENLESAWNSRVELHQCRKESDGKELDHDA